MTTLPDFNEIKSILFKETGIEVKENDNFLELQVGSKEKYYALRTSSGILLNIIYFTITNTQIQSKCPLSCIWSSNSTECNGHEINDFMESVKNFKISRKHIVFDNLGPFTSLFVYCFKKYDHVNIYLISDGTLHGEIEFFKTYSFKILEILEHFHKSGNIKSMELILFKFNDIYTYLITSLLRQVSNNIIVMDNKNTITTLANFIEMLWSIHRSADVMPDDMKGFIDKCKSDSKLLPAELLKHRFFQGEKKILNSDIKSRLNIDFKILKEVGKGAFGRVIMVKHLLDNQLYAIKRVPIKNEKEFNDKTKEIDLLARLTHENVVRYYNSWIEEATEDDFDESSSDGTGSEMTDSINQINSTLNSVHFFNKIMCIQMEFCEKSTLRLAIDKDLSIDHKRRLLLFNGIRNGLFYIHSQHIIHRDLNPRNIFINSNDQIKIGDFGQATTTFLVLKSNNTYKPDPSKVGTFLYIAPELMENTSSKDYDQRVDLYSLGIIYFEMCNPPFKTDMERYEKIEALVNGKIVLNFRPDRFKYDEYNVIKALVRKNSYLRMTACLELSMLDPIFDNWKLI